MKKNLFIILFSICCITLLNSCSKEASFSSNSGTTGTGGSLARFTIYGNYMYVVDGTSLSVYNISNTTPLKVSTIEIGTGIETIYPYNGNLFIGSQNAMYIYSLNNPEYPENIGYANHFRACDPVVADSSFAFVTVRSSDNGSSCGGTTNALMIYNVQQISNPNLIGSYNLSNPHGLGIKNKYLYVCDDNGGLKTFNVENPLNISLKSTKTGYSFYDVIPYGDVLICMVEGGMVIYNIDDPANPVFESKTF